MTPALRSAAAALLVAALAGCGGGGPADTAEAFQRHVESGETSAAVALMDPAVTQMMGAEKMEAALAAQTTEIRDKGGIASIRVLSETVTGETATVEMETTFGNGESDTETVALRKVDGDWRLSPEK